MLEVCILRVLVDGPTNGYVIATRLAASGVGGAQGGTLYPLLDRVEVLGLVCAQWRAGDVGPGRKYYALTAAGQRELHDTALRWSRFTAETAEIIGVDHIATEVLS